MTPASKRAAWLVAVAAFVTCQVFGVIVYHKAVRLGQGDQDVFFRAGWAARQGGVSLYHVTDKHGWHYHYPPLYALLMVPLADPPPEVAAEEGRGTPGRAVSTMVLYELNVVFLALAAQLLIGCLRREGDSPIQGQLVAFGAGLACFPAVCLTLMRGQVDTLLLLLLAGFVAGLCSGRRAMGGACLALAICIKIIPAFLLLVPLWRRDGRCLAGVAAGLVVGLWLVPALAFGPARTIELYNVQRQVFLEPSLGVGNDNSRSGELLSVGSTHGQSFQRVLHQIVYFGRPRPAKQAAWVGIAHWLLVAALTSLVLWCHGRPTGATPRQTLALVGLLAILMSMASPVSHIHYFTLCFPAAMVVMDRLTRGEGGWLSRAALLLLPIGYGAAMLPPINFLRELGLPAAVTLLLFTAALAALRPSGEAVRRGEARLAA